MDTLKEQWEVSHSGFCLCSSCRSCSFCGKCFSTAGSRKRHERDKHIETLSLACEYCGKWYKNRGALIKHRSISHRSHPNPITTLPSSMSAPSFLLSSPVLGEPLKRSKEASWAHEALPPTPAFVLP